jgi:electron transfer flavoprotein alpha subunit
VSGIWVYAEVRPDAVDPSALELATKARALGEEVAAVALGPGAAEAARALGEHGVATVFVDDDPVYADYPGEPATHVLGELVRRHHPELVLFRSSYESRDVAGRLQALLGTTLVANVDDVLGVDRVRLTVALRLWPGRAGNLRGGIGGPKTVEVTMTGPAPRLVLARPGSFAAEAIGGQAKVVAVDVDVPPQRRRARRLQRHEEQGTGVRLEDAKVVVAGGRGLGDRSNLALLNELAVAIGNAAVGVTRPVVDSGWAPFAMQIGQTGTTVSPDVYIAVGISGAPQHTVGFGAARRVIAINKDRDAPIFQLADLGVVGDALKIVPAVIEELRTRHAPDDALTHQTDTAE